MTILTNPTINRITSVGVASSRYLSRLEIALLGPVVPTKLWIDRSIPLHRQSRLSVRPPFQTPLGLNPDMTSRFLPIR